MIEVEEKEYWRWKMYKEKKQDHKEHREVISKGHGVYMHLIEVLVSMREGGLN